MKRRRGRYAGGGEDGLHAVHHHHQLGTLLHGFDGDGLGVGGGEERGGNVRRVGDVLRGRQGFDGWNGGSGRGGQSEGSNVKHGRRIGGLQLQFT